MGAFAKALAKAPLIAAVAPFEHCFWASSLVSSAGRPVVTPVDLVLRNENAVWRIYGPNSMVQASSEALCLAFVDGGEPVRTSIVIGG